MKHMLSSIVMASGLLLGSSLVATAWAAGAQGAPKPDAAKGEQLYTNGDPARGILACVSCHGAGGNSVIPLNPNLAAMPHEYITKQLVDFAPKGDTAPARGGANGAPSVMTPFASALNEQDRQNIALYLAQQPLDPATAATATKEATMERGQKIWRGGLPDRGVPACAGCHSANGAGLPASYPRLSGQHVEYLATQLKLFRSGERKNNDVMTAIADRMSDADIAAVADYAAGLR
ncbi:c-type cytochrome [Pusillimonas sp. TS35]|uniref:c-type cytochrome n=1 Tax=Paracandidimonas lactea TaxID=2895524 RepID=UPI00136E39FB|nr:c-type cytochrome [Paracandidimonas lactea]MYN12694.1 c-type cytochrome [Pusillimonas sp. TS35]